MLPVGEEGGPAGSEKWCPFFLPLEGYAAAYARCKQARPGWAPLPARARPLPSAADGGARSPLQRPGCPEARAPSRCSRRAL